jgi:predicted Holliday junction resolvase-like endonuclease
MYEIGNLVGQKRATDKFPKAKKAAVQRSRSVLRGMFAEQLAPLRYSPPIKKSVA